MKKVTNSVKVRPPKGLFENASVGRASAKPLIHKDGSHYSDVDYFELLGRKCLQLDKENPYKDLPVNYQQFGFDQNVCEVAKNVVKAIDQGRPKQEVERFLSSCININE